MQYTLNCNIFQSRNDDFSDDIELQIVQFVYMCSILHVLFIQEFSTYLLYVYDQEFFKK